MASTRLPGKPLADIGGVPMIVQVWRRACEADVGPVLVACAEQEIADAVTGAGGVAVGAGGVTGNAGAGGDGVGAGGGGGDGTGDGPADPDAWRKRWTFILEGDDDDDDGEDDGGRGGSAGLAGA